MDLKNLRNLPHGLDVYYLVNDLRKIAQVFVAFSEKLNFTNFYIKIEMSWIREPMVFWSAYYIYKYLTRKISRSSTSDAQVDFWCEQKLVKRRVIIFEQ